MNLINTWYGDVLSIKKIGFIFTIMINPFNNINYDRSEKGFKSIFNSLKFIELQLFKVMNMGALARTSWGLANSGG